MNLVTDSPYVELVSLQTTLLPLEPPEHIQVTVILYDNYTTLFCGWNSSRCNLNDLYTTNECIDDNKNNNYNNNNNRNLGYEIVRGRKSTKNLSAVNSLNYFF